MLISTLLSGALLTLTNLSAPGRVVLFFLIWVMLWLPIAIPLAIALKWRPPQPITVSQKLPLLASLYLIAPPVLWGATRVEGVSLANYGLILQPSFLLSIIVGLGMGALGIGLLFAVQWLLGWVYWQSKEKSPGVEESPTEPLPPSLSKATAVDADIAPQSPPKLASVLLPTLLLGLWVSGTEEVIFRGFLLNQFQQLYWVGVAAAIASLIFAVLHLVWEGQENIPQLPGLWLMGMVLVLARWVDGGSLGLAWGLHAGWIWGMASLDTAESIAYSGKGPEWMTGLAGKPLAGGMAILLLLGTGAILWGVF